MLTFLRSAAGTLFAKILLTLLVGSFAIWGISGAAINVASGTLGSVGSIKISTLDFQREYAAEINRLGRQFGQPLTPIQARQFGIDRQVLARMINQATLDDRAQAFGVGISDERIADEILKDSAFHNARGKFDPFRYQQLIAGAGMSERAFLEEQKKSYARQQVIDTLIGDVAVSDVLKKALKTHTNEERTVEYLEVDVRDIEPVQTPDDATLQTYFDANKTFYRAPEYRSLQYMAIQASNLGGAERISDADARQFYENNKARFTKLEKRTVRRINFETEAKARDAQAKLDAGTTFDDLVRELNLTPQDVSLGTLTKDAILDKKLADAAFALEPNKPSGVIDGDFSKMIAIVDAVEGGSTETFESLTATIKSEIAVERNNRELVAKLDQVEDARAAGSTFSEIAAKFALKLVKVENVSQSGELQAGGVLSTDTPGRDDLLREAFQSDVGLENDVIEIGRSGFVWYEVSKIEPARDRTFDEVKKRLTEDWLAEETAKAVRAKADQWVSELKSGKSILRLKSELGRDSVRISGVRRNQDAEGLSDEAVNELFKGAKGYVTSAPGERPNQAYVLKVTDVKDGTGATDDEIAANLKNTLQNDVIATYINQVREREGSSVNPEALELATDLNGQRSHNGGGY